MENNLVPIFGIIVMVLFLVVSFVVLSLIDNTLVFLVWACMCSLIVLITYIDELKGGSRNGNTRRY